jgi:signal-transduction protein with cAMP-binding, CBS, and nucleotidyltransferase domain
MNSPVITAGPRENVRQVAQRMADHRVGSVVVLERQRPIGIVTDGDIVTKVVVSDTKPSQISVKRVMSTPLHTIESEKDLTEAARLMRRLHVKRLGVTYKGDLVGVVSVSDLNAATPELVGLLSEKARIVTGDVPRARGFVAGYCDGCERWSDYLMEIDGRFLCEDCRGGAPGE